jgi:ParB-like nuclease domain
VRSQQRNHFRRDRIKVVYHQLDKLRSNPKNARLHSPRQIRQIAQSIEAFGFIVPILVDRDLQVIVGHGRVSAARKLRLERVPTIRLHHRTEAQAKAFMIADNRLTENSTWDERLLAEQLRNLSVLDLDFSLEATGFSMGEIDIRIEGLTSPSETEDLADEAPTHTGPTVSKLGDLWLLGRHRVYCGSALDQSSYAALMGDELAAAVFTDPPYNVPIAGNVSGLGAVRHHDFVMGSGEMDGTEFTAFLNCSCSLLARHSGDGSIHFVCRLAACERASCRRARSLHRAQKSLRLCQGQRWDGFSVSQPTRTDLRLQTWSRCPSQQYPARRIWPQSKQRLALSGATSFSGQSTGKSEKPCPDVLEPNVAFCTRRYINRHEAEPQAGCRDT